MSGSISGHPAVRRSGRYVSATRARIPAITLLVILLGFVFPRATRAADAADDRWSGQFSTSGVDGTVECSLLNGTDLYVGGSFTSAGDLAVHNIARWDGANWQQLGSGGGEGLNGTVFALAVYGGSLYAGGYFSSTGGGGPLLRGLARWDGVNWVAVGGGIGPGGAVFAFTQYNGNLIVGGTFSEVGSPPQLQDNIVGWNGTAWVSLAGGLDKIVRALTIYDNELIAGGYFIDRLVRFNGTNWARVGGGFDPIGGIEALAVLDSILYVGGSFYAVNGISTPAANLASWNGATFSPLGAGCGVAAADTVYELATLAGQLIIGGSFLTPGTGVVRWDGSTFGPLGGGVQGTVKAFSTTATLLYVGGEFRESSSGARNLVRWNNPLNQFQRLNPSQGVDNVVTHLGNWNNRLVVGGSFVFADAQVANGIALFDAASMTKLGTGLVGNAGASPLVYGSTTFSSALVIGGEFSQAGGSPASNLARWDGSAWSTLGVGFDGRVADVEIFNTELLAAGRFTHALDFNTPVSHLSRWDGTRWQPLGGGVSGSGEVVNALAVYNGELIVAGSFSTAGVVPANRIARWNGTTWAALGSGVNGAVTSLAVLGGTLYVGGFFTTAGGQPIPYLARWNGSAWSAVGTGPDSPVLSLTATGTNLYAGGFFATVGGAAAANVAQWNGFVWSRMGSGTDGDVQALAFYKDGVYAGGLFRHAGAKSSEHLARWSIGASAVGEPGPAAPAFALSPAWPNPFETSTTVRFTLPDAGPVQLAVFDAAGRLLAPPRSVQGSAGSQILTWDGRDADGATAPAGVYFLRVETPFGAAVRKVLLTR